MQASSQIKNFIKTPPEEGLRLTRVNDGTGHFEIGWGHTWKPGDPETITLAQAEQYFANDILVAEVYVTRHVVVTLLQNEFDSLISFTYNLGSIGAEILNPLNKGQKLEAVSYFTRFCHSNNQAIPGLLDRRIREASIFRGLPIKEY